MFSISSCISFGHLYLFRNFSILSKPLHGTVFEGAAPPSLAAEPGVTAGRPFPARLRPTAGPELALWEAWPARLAEFSRVLSKASAPRKQWDPWRVPHPTAPSLRGASDNNACAPYCRPQGGVGTVPHCTPSAWSRWGEAGCLWSLSTGLAAWALPTSCLESSAGRLSPPPVKSVLGAACSPSLLLQPTCG